MPLLFSPFCPWRLYQPCFRELDMGEPQNMWSGASDLPATHSERSFLRKEVTGYMGHLLSPLPCPPPHDPWPRSTTTALGTHKDPRHGLCTLLQLAKRTGHQP